MFFICKIRLLGVFLSTMFLLFLPLSVHAAIDYSLNDLGGGRYEYLYTVSNDNYDFDIEEFSIFFDFESYENLEITSTPSSWDPILIQPDVDLEEDGMFDALALGMPLVLGEVVSGFGVSFDWIGSGIPGTQAYEFIDPDSFMVLDDGSTTLTAVPLPAGIYFMISGLMTIAGLGRSCRNRLKD
nr:hypothetical protein [uncultured Desulfobacter sp.]